jgi:hypothetical protein
MWWAGACLDATVSRDRHRHRSRECSQSGHRTPAPEVSRSASKRRRVRYSNDKHNYVGRPCVDGFAALRRWSMNEGSAGCGYCHLGKTTATCLRSPLNLQVNPSCRRRSSKKTLANGNLIAKTSPASLLSRARIGNSSYVRIRPQPSSTRSKSTAIVLAH